MFSSRCSILTRSSGLARILYGNLKFFDFVSLTDKYLFPLQFQIIPKVITKFVSQYIVCEKCLEIHTQSGFRSLLKLFAEKIILEEDIMKFLAASHRLFHLNILHAHEKQKHHCILLDCMPSQDKNGGTALNSMFLHAQRLFLYALVFEKYCLCIRGNFITN